MKNKSQLYAGIIWIISALSLAVFGIMLFFNSQIPGAPELVKFLSEIDSKYIYLAAFLSIFIEGLYFIGSFFPGSSLVMLVTIISGFSGYFIFSVTLFLIFVGWSFAGIVNIYFAKIYRKRILKLQSPEEYEIKNHPWATWFPAFRSSHEVAQVVEGGHPVKVFLSSLCIRFWATLCVGALAIVVPLIIDVKNLSDGDSLLTIVIVFVISFIVGVVKIRRYFTSEISKQNKNETMKNFTSSKAILQCEDKIIITQRDNKPGLVYANMWDLPGGGREGTETPFECLARETREELSIEIKPENIIYEKSCDSKTDPDFPAYFFVVNISKDDINKIKFGNEGQGWKLVTIDEFLAHDNVIPIFKERVSDYLEFKNIV